tara:strand:+ start:341 stop:1108 length:768 start_codon:yes stop_codon:yes gene_type:complete
MLILLSPAKGQNFEPSQTAVHVSEPRLLSKSNELIEILRLYSPDELMTLMNVSEKIGNLTAERFASFTTPFNELNAKPAAFAFSGDVYKGLAIDEFTESDLEFAQNHLRILSGLYGVLRPLDLIQPYRLEMGTRLDTKAGSDLYQYWGSSISESLMADLEEHEDDLVINLASNEYFKAVSASGIHTNINTPVFKDFKNGKYKIISFFAKNARGAMARWIVKEKVKEAIDLVNFREDGYEYNEELSEVNSPVFLRG